MNLNTPQWTRTSTAIRKANDAARDFTKADRAGASTEDLERLHHEVIRTAKLRTQAMRAYWGPE